MQGQMKCFALLLGVVLGCAEVRSSQGTKESPGSADPDAAVSGESCQSFQTRAEELLAEGQACQHDEDCALIGIDADCLYPFLCPAPLSRTADLDFVRDEAARLSAAYRACSDSCAQASCAGGLGVLCSPFTHRCTIEQLQR